MKNTLNESLNKTLNRILIYLDLDRHYFYTDLRTKEYVYARAIYYDYLLNCYSFTKKQISKMLGRRPSTLYNYTKIINNILLNKEQPYIDLLQSIRGGGDGSL